MSSWNPFANCTFSANVKEVNTTSNLEKSSTPAKTELPAEQPKGENTQIADSRSFFDRVWDGLTKEICPDCGQSGGQRTSRHHVAYEQRPGIATLKEKHYDRHGNVVGSTEREVHVMKRIMTYDQRYQCYICGNEWERHRECDLTRL